MKELNSLEQQLREWKPRQPGNHVARALFGNAGGSRVVSWREQLGSFVIRSSQLCRWAIPAVGCLAAVLTSVAPRSSHLSDPAQVPLDLADQASVCYASAVFHTEKNSFAHTTVPSVRVNPLEFTTPADTASETNVTIH